MQDLCGLEDAYNGTVSVMNSPDRISVTRSIRFLDINHRLKDPFYVFTAHSLYLSLLMLVISYGHDCFCCMSSAHECDHLACVMAFVKNVLSTTYVLVVS